MKETRRYMIYQNKITLVGLFKRRSKTIVKQRGVICTTNGNESHSKGDEITI